MAEKQADLQEIHTVLKGATRSECVKFDTILYWFKECQIVDEEKISEEMFVKAYKRLDKDRGDLTLTQFISLLTILSRQSGITLKTFEERFSTVKPTIISEIREYWRQREREAAVKSEACSVMSISHNIQLL